MRFSHGDESGVPCLELGRGHLSLTSTHIIGEVTLMAHWEELDRQSRKHFLPVLNFMRDEL